MKKELSRKQKIQNVLFILLNLFLVLLGFCFIAIKIDDYKLISMVIFLVYITLGYYFIYNIIDLQNINKKNKYYEKYNKKEN